MRDLGQTHARSLGVQQACSSPTLALTLTLTLTLIPLPQPINPHSNSNPNPTTNQAAAFGWPRGDEALRRPSNSSPRQFKEEELNLT